MPKDNATSLAMVQKRVDAGDADAVELLASNYYYGHFGLKKDVHRAIELFTDAAELGSARAQFTLGGLYYDGNGVEEDKMRGVELLQRAAMKGDVASRYLLGNIMADDRVYYLARHHWMISAKMGDKRSLDAIRKLFFGGFATKAHFAAALKGYQDAVEETKSYQREEAMEKIAKSHQR